MGVAVEPPYFRESADTKPVPGCRIVKSYPNLPPAVFLDRDGTINQDSADYIKNWSEFIFLPRSIEAMRDLTAADYLAADLYEAAQWIIGL